MSILNTERMSCEIDSLSQYSLLSPLAKAVLDGDTHGLEKLLASGADPVALDSDGTSPICKAIQNGEQQYFIDMLAKVKKVQFSPDSHLTDLDRMGADKDDIWGSFMAQNPVKQSIVSLLYIPPPTLFFPSVLAVFILPSIMRWPRGMRESISWSLLIGWTFCATFWVSKRIKFSDQSRSNITRNIGNEIMSSFWKYGGQSEDMLLAFVSRVVIPDFALSHPIACRSLLINACCRGHTRVTESLLSRGVRVHSHCIEDESYPYFTPEEWAYDPVYFSALEGNPEIIAILLDHGASIEETPGTSLGSPLVAAAAGAWQMMNWEVQKRYERCMLILLKAGADPNTVDRNGCTALSWVNSAYQLNTISLLLKHGANPNIADKDGITPLHRALKTPFQHIVIQALLEAGADPTIPEKHGITPLHSACELGWSQHAIRALLKTGLNPNIVDNQGMTPLHKACEFESSPQTIRTLVEAGADPNLQDMYGLTPFHRSWRFSYIHNTVAPTLRELGADPDIPDKRGRLPSFQFWSLDEITGSTAEDNRIKSIRQTTFQTPIAYASVNDARDNTRRGEHSELEFEKFRDLYKDRNWPSDLNEVI